MVCGSHVSAPGRGRMRSLAGGCVALDMAAIRIWRGLTATKPRNVLLERAVIQSKLAVPALSDHVVERPRLHEAIAELIERHRVVVVSATAGAGKTPAGGAAPALVARPLAWLSVDRTDVAAGRLVTYLEAALACRIPHVAGAATAALEAGIPHAEATGLLAEALGDEPLVLVLDDLERLGDDPDAWAVIEAFLRYAPAGV